MAQTIIDGLKESSKLDEILTRHGKSKVLLVCGSSFDKLEIKDYLLNIKATVVRFSDFTVNPDYTEVVKGVDAFIKSGCDSIIAVGGGSAIDVAKCIKLFATMERGENYLEQEFLQNDILLIAIPTTAGTGSESTRYAVIYYDGLKQSVTHQSIVPSYAILESSTLKNLPLFQKKCTLFDALCQAIEAFWSVNSTDESKIYSSEAIKKIVKYNAGYMQGDENCAREIMLASSFAGRAINIAQTTSAHAMSYKMSALYNFPHGLAVALLLPKIWRYMIANTDKCADARGEQYLVSTFNQIARLLGYTKVESAIEYIESLLKEWDMPTAKASEDEIEQMASTVNATRLKNNPVMLDGRAIREIYKKVL